MSDDRLNELAPCPFCDGEAEIVDAEEAGPDARVVCCKGCSASSKVIFALKDDVTDLLVEAWNRRAHLPSNEISSATFDTLEALSKKFPDLGGYYARRTGGADLEHFVQFLAPFALDRSSSNEEVAVKADVLGDENDLHSVAHALDIGAIGTPYRAYQGSLYCDYQPHRIADFQDYGLALAATVLFNNAKAIKAALAPSAIRSALEPSPAEPVAWPKRRINIPYTNKSNARVVGFIIEPGDEAYGELGLSEPLAWLDRMTASPAPKIAPAAEGWDFMSLAAHLAKINAGRPVVEGAETGTYVHRDVCIEAMQALLSASRQAPETQATIGEWADEVFGPVMDLARAVERASEEMVELHEEADGAADPDKMIVEAADVVIVLMRFAQAINRDLNAAINAKMAVNRERQWNSDGTGHGYHVSPAQPGAQNNDVVGELEAAYGILWRQHTDVPAIHSGRRALRDMIGKDGQRRGIDWARSHFGPHPEPSPEDMP